MSKNRIEEISALIDGEHDHDSQTVIDHLCEDEHLRHLWARYHLIGDCLRSHLPEYVSNEMGERVRHALQSEPAILAPQSVVRRYLKPLAGLAIAASVATVAILGIQQDHTSVSINTSGQVAAIQAAPTGTQQFTFAPRQLVRHTQLVTSEKVDAKERLNSYLVNYDEQRASAGKHGILPYVRIVAHEKQE